MDYAISVWGNCIGVRERTQLTRLQKRAARYVTGNFDFVNSRGEDLMKDLKWSTVEQRRDYF